MQAHPVPEHHSASYQATKLYQPLAQMAGLHLCHLILNTKHMKADKIKFGTDGWRAIIAQDFTVYNVARVSEGLAQWLLKDNNKPRVVLGHDCRFGGELFSETVAKVLCEKGVEVLLARVR